MSRLGRFVAQVTAPNPLPRTYGTPTDVAMREAAERITDWIMVAFALGFTIGGAVVWLFGR